VADRPKPSQTAPGASVRLAAAVLLLVGGIFVLVLAASLGAAALRRDLAPVDLVMSRGGHALWAVLLCAALVILAGLVLITVPRQRERVLWLRAEHGGVLVSLAALQRIAEAAALRHPEVVRAEARLRERDGAPYGSVRLYARPLVDAARVGGDVETQVRAAIDLVIGREATRVAVKPTVLRVRQLKRYLP
jgi:hypothetical protein